MHWREFGHGKDAVAYMANVAQRIRKSQLDLGRPHYALTLSMGVVSAIFCGVGKIVAVEFGVGGGASLLDLCKAAEFFRNDLGFEIEVYGLDNATGLPRPVDHRDHPELWHTGMYMMRDAEALRAKLPPFAHLLIGDVADTTPMLRNVLGRESPLGFVAIDVDYYSSAMPCLNILLHEPSCYLPAVPMYFDDLMSNLLTFNAWCGEAWAITVFNAFSESRKIQENRLFNTMHPIRPFHSCQILDHPLRTGREPVRKDFSFLHLQFY
jgi:hypothetical protein